MRCYSHIVQAHRPAGYEIKERNLRASDGIAEHTRRITVKPITSRHALAVFLHECGHVVCGHLRVHERVPDWLKEYEADQYAIKAMREEGIAMPRATLDAWKQALREILHLTADHHDIDDEVLRYAYGRGWQKHR